MAGGRKGVVLVFVTGLGRISVIWCSSSELYQTARRVFVVQPVY